MNCMKCGRELKGTEVFCPECAAQMEKYPVKPGTPVQLPYRTAAPPSKKKSKRRILKPEEQIAKLRHSLRLLTLALVVLMIAFILVTVMLLQVLDQRDRAEDSQLYRYSVEERMER
ncbi:MAG: hypothetical protein ACI4PO_11905 [Faecousia sp.]